MSKTPNSGNHRFARFSSIIVSVTILVIGILIILYSLVYLDSTNTARFIIGAIGTSVLAAGIVYVIVQIGRLISAERIVGRNRLHNMSSDRNFLMKRYADEIMGCKSGDLVKIMGISLQSLLNVPRIEDILLTKIKENVSFRIIIMRRDSKYLKYRIGEYKYRTHLNYEIEQFSNFYSRVRSELKDNEKQHFELRFHEFAPRFFFLTTSKRIFFQFYIYGFGEFNGPCFEFDRNTEEISVMMEKSFDYLWDHIQTTINKKDKGPPMKKAVN